MNRYIIILAGLLLMAISASASDGEKTTLRPVTSIYGFSAGSSHLTDTYLSPMKYSGWTVGLSYERWQALKGHPEDWAVNLKFALRTDKAENSPRNATMWNFDLNMSWSMFRKFRLPFYGIVAGAGGRATLNLGCLYTSRNGNNPASAKGSLTIDATAYIAKRLLVHGKTLDLRYSTGLPLIGAFFSPDYGELYYEIWLGNHSGLAHCAWPGNFFRWDNHISVGMYCGNTLLSLGYRCNVFSSKINHITTNIISHALVFGVGGDWISLSPGSKAPSRDTKIISAFY